MATQLQHVLGRGLDLKSPCRTESTRRQSPASPGTSKGTCTKVPPKAHHPWKDLRPEHEPDRYTQDNCTGPHHPLTQGAGRLPKPVHEMLLIEPGQNDQGSLMQDGAPAASPGGLQGHAAVQIMLAWPFFHSSPSHQADLARRTETSAQWHRGGLFSKTFCKL